MSIGLLIVTHVNIGRAMLETATRMLGVCPVATEVLEADWDCRPEELRIQARKLVAKLDDGDGVLVLTDMYGGTPSNIANSLSSQHKLAVVTGLNLPMLVRILNYASLDLDEVAEKAYSGGRAGVFSCERKGVVSD